MSLLELFRYPRYINTLLSIDRSKVRKTTPFGLLCNAQAVYNAQEPNRVWRASPDNLTSAKCDITGTHNTPDAVVRLWQFGVLNSVCGYIDSDTVVWLAPLQSMKFYKALNRKEEAMYLTCMATCLNHALGMFLPAAQNEIISDFMRINRCVCGFSRDSWSETASIRMWQNDQKHSALCVTLPLFVECTIHEEESLPSVSMPDVSLAAWL